MRFRHIVQNYTKLFSRKLRNQLYSCNRSFDPPIDLGPEPTKYQPMQYRTSNGGYVRHYALEHDGPEKRRTYRLLKQWSRMGRSYWTEERDLIVTLAPSCKSRKTSPLYGSEMIKKYKAIVSSRYSKRLLKSLSAYHDQFYWFAS